MIMNNTVFWVGRYFQMEKKYIQKNYKRIKLSVSTHIYNIIYTDFEDIVGVSCPSYTKF